MNFFKVLKSILFLLPILGALFLASVNDTSGSISFCGDEQPTCQVPPNELQEFNCSADICPTHKGIKCRLCITIDP